MIHHHNSNIYWGDFRRGHGPKRPDAYRALWRAVILTALHDLVSESETYEGLIAQGEARRWFFKFNPGFIAVCDLAGVDPLAMRKRAREIETDPSLLGAYNV